MVSILQQPILRKGDQMIILAIKYVPHYIWVRYNKDWFQREPDSNGNRKLVRAFGRTWRWDIPDMDMLVVTFENSLPKTYVENILSNRIVDRFTI